MNALTVRRMAAGAMVAVMALVLPAAPGWAETEEKPAVAAPGPAAEPAGPPQPKITKDEALARLKQYFPVPQESAKVSLDGNLSTRGTRVAWDFMINITVPGGSMGTSLATVDAMTGRILAYTGGYFVPTPVRQGPAAPARPEAEARGKAWQLVAEMYPDLAPHLKLQDPALAGVYPNAVPDLVDAYQFTWEQEVNGVPFPMGSISVGVDKATLAYTSMSANLPEGIQFPEGTAQVDAKAAMAAWIAASKPTLTYMPVISKSDYGSYTPSEFRLAYQFTVGQAVDALTGKLATVPNWYVWPAGEPEAVSAGPVQPVLSAALPLTDAEAYRLTAELFGLKNTDTIRAEGPVGLDDSLIQLFVRDTGSGGSVAFDRTTGMVRSANRYQTNSQPPQQPAGEITPEQEAEARQAAIGVVQKYYSQFVPELRIQPGSDPYWTSDNTARRFTFRRFVNGVAVGYDSVGVTIDLATMAWRDMNANWTTGVTFGSATPILTAAQASDMFFAGRQARLVYRPVQPPIDPDTHMIPEPSAAELVYVMVGGQAGGTAVDAVTGHLLGGDGKSAGALDAAMKQIQGHWAEGELRFLLAGQVIDPAALNPAAPVTRMQAVQMLLQRQPQYYGRDSRPVQLPYTDLKQSDPMYGRVAMAYREGWLTPGPADNLFRSEAPITRAEFAVWAARALGLGDLARSPLSVTPAYGDLSGLSGEEVNSIHFLRYLGILSPADRFRGMDPLTQAEGAAVTARLYNYLLAR